MHTVHYTQEKSNLSAQKKKQKKPTRNLYDFHFGLMKFMLRIKKKKKKKVVRHVEGRKG